MEAVLFISIVTLAAGLVGLVGLVAHMAKDKVSELEEDFEASTAELQAAVRAHIDAQAKPEIHVLRSGKGWTTIREV